MSDLDHVLSRSERGEHRHGERHRRRRNALVGLVALLVVVGLVGGLGLGGYHLLKAKFGTPSPDYAGNGTGAVVIQVHEGDTSAAIARLLKKKDVVKSVDAFLEAAKDEPSITQVQPGFYRLRLKMSAASAVGLLINPSTRILSKVTVPEGLRIDQTVATLAKGSDRLSATRLTRVLEHPSSLGLPSYAKGRPEGFLFPATYDVDPSVTDRSMLRDMVKRYRQTAAAHGIAKAQVDGRRVSPYDIVTIASLIEAEVNRPEDYAKVSRVVYNRLAKGMKLQFDSTVNYALKADKTNVTLEDLRVNSPYNTYRNVGLPPGPIGSPGEAAIAAAIHPAPGNWLYFVTVDLKSGETKFTGSYQQFLSFKRELKAKNPSAG
jgi:peptidoglycan lytic transglycosylase G